MSGELPTQILFNREQTERYWENLKPVRYIYKGHDFQHGFPIMLPKTTVNEITQAATEVLDVVEGLVNRSGGVTNYLRDTAPRIGDLVLNNPQINSQLESRIQRGYRLPIIYDVILTNQRGVPQWKVVELQSGIAYSAQQIHIIKAAGFDPNNPNSWGGEKNPLTVLENVKRDLSSGEDIVVMDTDPFGGSLPDQVGMAKILGRPDSLPISLLDVEEDEEGYFYYPYVADPTTRGPIKDSFGKYVKGDSKARLKNVLARMTQLDLDEANELLAESPKKSLIYKFLQDPSVNWIYHPAWQYIIDKSTIPYIRKELVESESSLVNHFVPIFQENEEVPSGSYIKKPTNGVSGMGQSKIEISLNEKVTVEPGYVYQELFDPYPLRVDLSPSLRGAFPLPKDLPDHLRESFSLTDQQALGTLEIRYMPPPYCYQDLSGWFMARFAPRWQNPLVNSEITQTNQGKIQDAMWNSPIITSENYIEYPFGWCPVIVKSTLD